MDGWDETEEWITPTEFIPSTKVSVIIAARNEEDAIQQCVLSILNCDYPPELLEIFVINDHSEDSTAEKVLALNHSSVKLINLNESTGKKNALAMGIENASGSVIALTDADCLVPTLWLKSIISYYETFEPKCIAGPISYLHDKTLLQRFQYLDAINNMCVTANGIRRGTYHMANGANLIFQKSAFGEVGGYTTNTNYASGDDMFLIQQISKKYPSKVSFIKSKDAIVLTQPETSLSELKMQRTRWATKSKGYQDKGIIKIQGFVFLFVITLLINLLYSPIGSGLSLFGFLFALFIKWTIDYLYLSKLAQFFGHRKPLKSFFGASIAFIFYILFAGWKAMTGKSYTWKGRETS